MRPARQSKVQIAELARRLAAAKISMERGITMNKALRDFGAPGEQTDPIWRAAALLILRAKPDTSPRSHRKAVRLLDNWPAALRRKPGEMIQ